MLKIYVKQNAIFHLFLSLLLFPYDQKLDLGLFFENLNISPPPLGNWTSRSEKTKGKKTPQTLFELLLLALSFSFFSPPFHCPFTSLKQIKCQQISRSSAALLSPPF